MKAVVQSENGSPEVLEFRDIDRPVVEDDEVLVPVRQTPSALARSAPPVRRLAERKTVAKLAERKNRAETPGGEYL